MASLTTITLCVSIALTSALPQFGNPFFSNPQQQGSQNFPNQGFQNQAFPNQGFPNQGFQNQGFQNQPQVGQFFPNQGLGNLGFPNQGFPNQGLQNNQQFRPNPNNPFLQGQNPSQNQQNPQIQPNQQNQGFPGSGNVNNIESTEGTLEEFIQRQPQGQNQQQLGQQQLGQQQPTPQTPIGQTTTPSAAPAQSPAFIACNRNCQTTMEYNPVCGTDQVGYPNIRRLECANRCGQQLDPNWQEIRVFRDGACTSGQRVP